MVIAAEILEHIFDTDALLEKIKSRLLAKLFPVLGRSLIVKAVKR